MNTQICNDINDIINEMKTSFYERDRIINAAWAALLSRQHMLLLGVPGTAKSQIIKSLCKRVHDANYFKWLLTRFSTPEELFGPVSLKGLENDNYCRIVDGKLPEANIAFVDEIFKGNAAILNSLLSVVNEREFDNGKDCLNVPLISMFGASNELPQGEELGALYDRFIIRFDVPYIQDGSNWTKLMMGDNIESIGTSITIAQLSEAQDAVCKVVVTHDVVSIMREIKVKLEREGIIASDRRWKQTISVLQAWAWLDGRDTIERQDLELLCDMLWDEPEQRATIVSIVLSITNPLDLAAVKIYDDIKDVFTKWDKTDTANTNEVAVKIRRGMEMLDETIKTGREELLTTTRTIRQTLGVWYKEVLSGMDI